MPLPPNYAGSDDSLTASERLRLWCECWPELAREFRMAFSFRSGDSVEHTCALGAEAEIRVHVDQRNMSFELHRSEHIVLAAHERRRNGETIYRQMFDSLATFRDKAHDWLDRERIDSRVCIGGWRALPSLNGREEVARFTIPRRWCLERRKVTRELDSVAPHAHRMGRDPSIRSTVPCRIVGESPDRERYWADMREIVRDLDASPTRKVVVARQVRVRSVGDVDPLDLLERLVNGGMGEVYSYIFQWGDRESWVGISPEPLLVMTDAKFLTTILAGTRSPRADDRAADGWPVSSKEEWEHRAAVELMRHDLQAVSHSGSLSIGRRRVAGLRYAEHLQTEVRGSVRADIGPLHVLARIYPPATVWGTPRAWSGERIAAFESFRRGFYTGGLGYLARDGQANFALAIRTAALRGDRIDLFAGGGIVAGADPQLEWQETMTKLRPFLAVLGAAEAPR